MIRNENFKHLCNFSNDIIYEVSNLDLLIEKRERVAVSIGFTIISVGTTRKWEIKLQLGGMRGMRDLYMVRNI
jgi:hypothetical protein